MKTVFVNGLSAYASPNDRGSVVTVGTFDGIHRGHQEIFRRVRETAGETGLNPVLVTFHPHPKVVVSPQNIPMLLTSIEEKKQFLPDFFPGQVLILEFNARLKELSAEQFVKDILVDRLGVKRLIVGYDHAFGRNRSGNIAELRRLGAVHGFELEVVEPVLVKGKPISSSRIRSALQAGEFQAALDLLGHEYAVFGIVERGIGLGRKIGYPTANVCYSHRKLLPPEGIYACWNEIDGEVFPGMMFIGQNHFNPVERITLETNLFDFDRDIYDHNIVVYPTTFIRNSEKFESTTELVAQLKEDKKNALEILRKEQTHAGD